MSDEYIVRVLKALSSGVGVSVDYTKCSEKIEHIIRSAATSPGRTVIIRNMPDEYVLSDYLRRLCELCEGDENMHPVEIVVEL
jgi:hypothetical protein